MLSNWILPKQKQPRKRFHVFIFFTFEVTIGMGWILIEHMTNIQYGKHQKQHVEIRDFFLLDFSSKRMLFRLPMEGNYEPFIQMMIFTDKTWLN